jgi:hypothetical protein
MAEKGEKDRGGSRNIRIDYDNPDVEDIMDQIKKGIASRGGDSEKAAAEEAVPAEPAAPPAEPEPAFEPLVLSGKKRMLLKLMRPFAPLMKLLILPVHQEFLETVHRLDFTNRRLDFLNHRIEQALAALSQELYRSTDGLSRKVDGFNDAANQRLDVAFHNLGRTMEYTKLLHSLSHNMVVELSKLKIDEEDIKVKARILEKDFEFLRSRGEALEERVMK